MFQGILKALFIVKNIHANVLDVSVMFFPSTTQYGRRARYQIHTLLIMSA